uniref:Uncharacterized protein n=1 Tax=Oryza brachyantha TaxID=4533 RepID=J3LQ85_ORYBR
MTAPHHRHSRRWTEPHFNLGNNLLTETLALALVGEKLSKAEYKPPYSTSNTQEGRIMNAIGYKDRLREATKEKATVLLKLMIKYESRGNCIDAMDFRGLKRVS